MEARGGKADIGDMSMKLLKIIYEHINGKPAPYYYDYSLGLVIGKPIRKWVAQCLAPNCVFNNLRIFLYRLCGFKIGRHVFIGMKCYLDDMCYDLISIGDNVTISYGVYFACHGKNQGHYPITVEDGAYVGMRASIISKNSQKIGGGYDDRKKCHRWGLYIGEQGYSGRCDSSRYSLQNLFQRAYLRNEVLA